MPHVEGHISIAELLGNEQASKVTIESKPLVPPEQQTQQQAQQPLKPTKIPTLSEAREATQGKGLFGGIGDFLGSPEGKQTLIGVARGLDPQGVGGQLADVAETTLEGQQFANLTRKLEAGEEITAADVVGLSPQAQQQAAGVIAAKGAARRDQERIDITAKAVQSATELRQAQVEKIGLEPKEAQKERDATLANLEKRLASGTLNSRERNAALLKRAQLQLDRVEATTRGATGKKLTATDINTLSKSLLPLETFKIIQDKSGFGATDIIGMRAGGNEQETLAKLGNEGFSEEQFKTVMGREPNLEEKAELEVINRFKQQMDTFKTQAEFQPQLPVGTPAPVMQDKGAQVAGLDSMSPQVLSAIVGSIPVDQRELIEKALTHVPAEQINRAIAEVYIRNFQSKE